MQENNTLRGVDTGRIFGLGETPSVSLYRNRFPRSMPLVSSKNSLDINFSNKYIFMV